MAGLSREVIRWLQSLDLTWQVKNAKWDLSNGYLVAEIFSWYHPQAIQMHNYYTNCTSLKTKQLNWNLLNNFFKKHDIDIPPEYSEGTMHCKEGAAQLLIERMYEILTNRQVRKKEGNEIDFTDRAYQDKLPMHARTTASQAVKNNLKGTELKAQPSILHTQFKAHDVIRNHVEQRRIERLQNPERFDIKPTIAERAVRRPPPQTSAYDESSDMQVSAARDKILTSLPGTGKTRKSALKSKSSTREATPGQQSVTIPELPVKQMNTSSARQISVGGE
ncbi:SPATA4 [Bugula neritina]|uniref:SPATA4 n=1 Tax=Bugula neritina TaxID=10212 RepID=A0A7J7K8S3_BUGNE|nr:SPATA4 [Bugula neritina]